VIFSKIQKLEVPLRGQASISEARDGDPSPDDALQELKTALEEVGKDCEAGECYGQTEKAQSKGA
jgi:hypothetical protein